MENMHLEMKNISKSFGGLKALQHVNFSAAAGEVHALMGENGAGKSTLMKVLSGAYHKDEGEIFVGGKCVHITNPKSARDQGVSVIYQEFALAKHLTIAENIFLDNLAEGGRLINRASLNKKAADLVAQLGFDNIDVTRSVDELSVAYQQVVEICKAISWNSSVLVFDEPTAVLTSLEVEKLFSLIERLKQQGVCIVYVSHRLEEIFRICDRITVLKDGQNVDTVAVADIDKGRLVNMMVGRKLDDLFPPRNAQIGATVLKVAGLSKEGQYEDISFEVKAGEILGMYGLVGAGRTEAMWGIFGAEQSERGEIYINGEKTVIQRPSGAIRQGIAMLPEDRKRHGVLLDLPIRHNTTLAAIKRFCNKLRIFRFDTEISFVKDMVDKLQIKVSSIEQKVSELSGGNQQKVAISKCLAPDCKVLIFDEPTRGVDVGAKVEIYKVMNKLAESGMAIIMISSEMPEVIGMSDRVLVMRYGKIVAELLKDEITETTLIRHSMGVRVHGNGN